MKTIRLWGLLLALLLPAVFPSSLKGQNGGPALKTYTLKECVDYALSHATAVKTSKFDEYIAQRQVKEFKGIALPQARAGFEFQDFEIIPKMVFNGATFTFGTHYVAKADASVSQLIADGSFFIGLQAIKELAALTHKMTERTEIETIASVTKAYYNAQLNQERAKLLAINLSRLEKLLETTKALYAAGFVEKIDVSRLQIAYENLKTEKLKIENLLGLGYDLLKFQMGMEIDEVFVIQEGLDKEKFNNLPEPKIQPVENYIRRPEFALLDKQYSLQNLNMKRYQMGKFGNLVAYGSFQTQAMRNTFDYFQGGSWYNSLVFGLKLNVPIFDGLQSHNKVEGLRLEMNKIQAQREQLKRGVELEIKTAQTMQLNAWNTLQSMKLNLELAEEVYSISNTKYAEGVGSNLEMIDAESSLRQAETNYLAAVYDYILASLDLKKAKGDISRDPETFSNF